MSLSRDCHSGVACVPMLLRTYCGCHAVLCPPSSPPFRIWRFAEDGQSFRFPHRLRGCSPGHYLSSSQTIVHRSLDPRSSVSVLSGDGCGRMRDFNPAPGQFGRNAGWKIARPSEVRVMLAIGRASVLRGTRKWKGERRDEREGEESPPRVTQAHSRSSGRKLTVSLRMLDLMFQRYPVPVARSPPGHRLHPPPFP